MVIMFLHNNTSDFIFQNLVFFTLNDLEHTSSVRVADTFSNPNYSLNLVFQWLEKVRGAPPLQVKLYPRVHDQLYLQRRIGKKNKSEKKNPMTFFPYRNTGQTLLSRKTKSVVPTAFIVIYLGASSSLTRQEHGGFREKTDTGCIYA
jgi:hypothetical protein